VTNVTCTGISSCGGKVRCTSGNRCDVGCTGVLSCNGQACCQATTCNVQGTQNACP
jgi:hypothetical protein